MANPKVFLALSAVSLIGGIGACYYEYSAYATATENVARLTKQRQDGASIQKKSVLIAEELATSQSALQHLEQGLPLLAHVPTLMAELEASGKGHGLAVLGVRPLPIKEPKKKKDKNGEPEKEKKKPYVALDIEIKVRGSYGSVMRFLDSLQTFPKMAAVQMVSIAPQRGVPGEQALKLDSTITLRTFLFSDPPPASAGRSASTPFQDTNDG